MATPPFKVKAVYDYSSPHDDDLSFSTGQIITVVQEEDAEWYIGEYTDDSGNKQEGLFPKNFVEKFEPQAPPRPIRAKKEEQPAAVQAQPVTKPAEPAEQITQVEEREEPAPRISHQAKSSVSDDAPVQSSIPAPAPRAPEPVSEPVSQSSTPAKSAAPPVAEKSSSFRDRIAAFNKSTAAPSPLKPGPAAGGSTFIKKPFVAPPPLRNAYVPPPRQEAPLQKVYRREEDPEIAQQQAQDEEAAKRAGLMPTEGQSGDGEDAPKPTTLKERIAALQREQAEAQARLEGTHKEGHANQRPAKKRTESGGTIASVSHADDTDPFHDETSRASIDSSRDVPMPPINRRMSRESRASVGGRHEMHDDEHDAYDPGTGDSTQGEATEVEDHEGRARASAPSPLARTATGASSKDFTRQPPVHEEHEPGQHQEAESEEEDEMDAETRRKIELRARMAKMSGGMGMAGMFGGPMAMPQTAPRKKAAPVPSIPEDEATAQATPPRQRMPMVPIPGMGAPQVRSPPHSPSSERPPVVEHEPEPGLPMSRTRDAEEVPDVEDLESLPSAAVQSRAAPPIPQDRPLPPARQASGVAPPPPAPRSVPAAPEARAAPPPPPRAAMSPSADPESDDETPLRGPASPPPPPQRRDTSLSMRGPPPPVPGTASAQHEEPRSPTMAHVRQPSYTPDSPSMSTPPLPLDRRTSRGPPPIPGLPPMAPAGGETRAPPPLPPAAPPASQSLSRDDSDDDDEADEEYEGDYDTDRAPSTSQHAALASQQRDFADEGDASEDNQQPMRQSGPPPSAPLNIQRAMPPLPPTTYEPPSPPRRSLDQAPRAIPPPPPSMPSRPPAPPAEQEEYDPYRYTAPVHGLPPRAGPAPPRAGPAPPSSYQAAPPPPSRAMPPPMPQSPVGPAPPRAGPAPPPPGRAMPTFAPQAGPPPPPRQSQEYSDEDDADEPTAAPVPTSAPPPSFAPPPPSAAPVRRSVEQSRQSLDRGFIAKDVDLSQGSQWWTQANMPPPVFQNRADVLYEIEESSTARRGGRTTISKDVYVLFQDYSQTVITARFDSKAPADVALEQRHEAPPPRPRQDQLEAASAQFGRAIFNAAHSKSNHTAADGSAQAFVTGAIRSQPTALLPVGSRAYGAMIYVNIANATVQQLDEIRPGDIISFKNAKFQGKHGLSKYAEDVGKPDHVGVVVEWDGTKKKIRAYEQGRDSKKVKMESFRVGDLRSGEVKVWRVMGRGWVGWEGES